MNTDSFAQRHIGPRKNDLNKMLKTIGVDSITDLIEQTIPDDILLENKLSLQPLLTCGPTLENWNSRWKTRNKRSGINIKL